MPFSSSSLLSSYICLNALKIKQYNYNNTVWAGHSGTFQLPPPKKTMRRLGIQRNHQIWMFSMQLPMSITHGQLVMIDARLQLSKSADRSFSLFRLIRLHWYSLVLCLYHAIPLPHFLSLSTCSSWSRDQVKAPTCPGSNEQPDRQLRFVLIAAV